jgi:hypothetical protein
MQEAAKLALGMRGACNLAAVADLLPVVVGVLREEADRLGADWDWVNEHPIITLFLQSMADLNGYQIVERLDMRSARRAVEEMVNTNWVRGLREGHREGDSEQT